MIYDYLRYLVFYLLIGGWSRGRHGCFVLYHNIPAHFLFVWENES